MDLSAMVDLPNWPNRRPDVRVIRHNLDVIVMFIAVSAQELADQTNILSVSYKLGSAVGGQRRRGHPD
jgi:hypothetical protein